MSRKRLTHLRTAWAVVSAESDPRAARRSEHSHSLVRISDRHRVFGPARRRLEGACTRSTRPFLRIEQIDFFRKLLKTLRIVPCAIATARQGSDAAAKAVVMPTVSHLCGWRQNNRAKSRINQFANMSEVCDGSRACGAAPFCSVLIRSASSFGRAVICFSTPKLLRRDALALAGMGRRVGIDGVCRQPCGRHDADPSRIEAGSSSATWLSSDGHPTDLSTLAPSASWAIFVASLGIPFLSRPGASGRAGPGRSSSFAPL